MARAIPYIDTTVAVKKTVAEIEDILGVHGATHVMKTLEAGQIKALSFKHEDMAFQLPANVDAIYQLLLTKRRGSRYWEPDQSVKEHLHEQAERCAWRNVMFWVKAQLALVEIGMVTVHEVFLPYMLSDGAEGEEVTLYTKMVTGGFFKALTSGNQEEE